MTETDIECGHNKTTIHVHGVNRSRKIVIFSNSSSTNVNHNFMGESFKSTWVVLML